MNDSGIFGERQTIVVIHRFLLGLNEPLRDFEHTAAAAS
jgi:hypothetical protein